MDKATNEAQLRTPPDYDSIEDDDPIVAEVRRHREQILASFDYDAHRLWEAVRKAQEAHPERVVSFARKGSAR
jgi:hypothetical protein